LGHDTPNIEEESKTLMMTESILVALGVYGGVIILALWLALVVWAYRDMRARSRDRLAQLLVAISIAVLNIFGVFIYVLLRPRETLAEAYERSLEEEALLQEIEEKPSCPGCSQRVREEWQVCPNCHTRLKKSCHVCGHLLELPWTICPHCAAAQNRYLPEDSVVNASRHIERSAPRSPARRSAAAGGELPLSSSSPQILDEG